MKAQPLTAHTLRALWNSIAGDMYSEGETVKKKDVRCVIADRIMSDSGFAALSRAEQDALLVEAFPLDCLV